MSGKGHYSNQLLQFSSHRSKNKEQTLGPNHTYLLQVKIKFRLKFFFWPRLILDFLYLLVLIYE